MLITLVENAIKHGIEPLPAGGRIDVRAAQDAGGRLVLSVADTGTGVYGGGVKGQGIGLANIRERLALLFDGRASLELEGNVPRGFVARIVLPADTMAARPDAVPVGAPALVQRAALR